MDSITVLDKEGKSQIDGKTIKMVFTEILYYRGLIIVFTDHTYAALRMDNGYPTIDQMAVWYLSRQNIIENVFGNPPTTAERKAQTDADIQKLVDAGVYTPEDIRQMKIEGKRFFEADAIRRIAEDRRAIARQEQFISEIHAGKYIWENDINALRCES